MVRWARGEHGREKRNDEDGEKQKGERKERWERERKEENGGSMMKKRSLGKRMGREKGVGGARREGTLWSNFGAWAKEEAKDAFGQEILEM